MFSVTLFISSLLSFNSVSKLPSLLFISVSFSESPDISSSRRFFLLLFSSLLKIISDDFWRNHENSLSASSSSISFKCEDKLLYRSAFFACLSRLDTFFATSFTISFTLVRSAFTSSSFLKASLLLSLYLLTPAASSNIVRRSSALLLRIVSTILSSITE